MSRRRIIKPDGSFDSLFNKALDFELKQTNLPYVPGDLTEEKRIRFRVSGSPFCTYKFLFSVYEVISDSRMWDLGGDFFCGIGTSAHSTFQRWIALANPGRVLGNWRCLHCCENPYEHECISCKTKCKAYKQALVGPQICPICGRYMTYEEFSFVFPDIPVTGHCDGVLIEDPSQLLGVELSQDNCYAVDKLLRRDLDKKIDAYILEYKTSTRSKATIINEPQPEHKAQASMYVYRANEDFPLLYGLKGINIKGAIVKYISRDIPQIRSRDILFDVTDGGDFYEYNKKIVKRTLKAFKSGDAELLELPRLPCRGKYGNYYSTCPFMHSCSDLKQYAQEFLDKSRKKVLKSWSNFNKQFRS